MKSYQKHLKEQLKDKEFAEFFEEEKTLIKIALRLNGERRKKGLSQAELARKANITQQQLSKIERGNNSNMLTFLKVCKALNLNYRLQNVS